MLPWLILVLILLTAAAFAYYYWQTRVNIPQLTHTLLPPYEIPDVILVGGVLVENRGKQPAPNVKINVVFDDGGATMIHHMKVAGTENAVIRSGGERHTFATVSARSLRAHGKIVIYWAAARAIQPQISVTSYSPAPDTFMGKLLPRKTNS